MTLNDTLTKQRRQEWRTRLKPMQDDLRANRCPPHVLHSLAAVYYGGYRDVEGDTPRERLESLLGGEDSLAEAVLQAFRNSIDREDLPDVNEVLRLGARGETHFLAYPYMAGLHEISKASRDSHCPVDEGQWRLALAIYYTEPLWPLPLRIGDDTPPWFPPLLRSRPDLVAEMLVKATRRKLRRPSDFASGLYELAHSPDCKEVARMAALPLLKAFPVRCSRQRVQDLNHLLTAAVLHGEKAALLDLVRQKLSSQTMHVGQRVRWLAAGLFAAPGSYQAPLESYVSGHEPRIRVLAEITTRRFLEALPDSPDVPVLVLLIRLLGSSYGPRDDGRGNLSVEGRLISRDTDAACSIRFLCEQLARARTPEAMQSLESLRTEESLRAWRPLLADLAGQQKTRRGD